MIQTYPNVYTDLANHKQSISKKTRKKYFKILNDLLTQNDTKEKILFGTDWPMARQDHEEEDYTEAFNDGLTSPELDLVAFDNPKKFLFAGGKLPPRIRRFYTANGIALNTLPAWMV